MNIPTLSQQQSIASFTIVSQENYLDMITGKQEDFSSDQ